jgi:hypothetical protein
MLDRVGSGSIAGSARLLARCAQRTLLARYRAASPKQQRDGHLQAQ